MRRRALRELWMGHPFEILISLQCVVAGIPAIFGVTTSAVVQRQLGGWLALWGFMLAVGGLLCLIGLLWGSVAASVRTLITAYKLEIAGWCAVISGLLVSTAGVVVAAGISGMFQAAMTAAWAAGACARALMMRRALKGLEKTS